MKLSFKIFHVSHVFKYARTFAIKYTELASKKLNKCPKCAKKHLQKKITDK